MPVTDITQVLSKNILASASKWKNPVLDWLKETDVSVDDIGEFANTVIVDPVQDIVLTNFEFKEISASQESTIVAEKTISNPSDVKVTDTFTYSKSVEDVFAFKFSEGLKMGTKVTVEARVPVIKIGGSVEVYGETTFDAEQSWSKKVTETFSDSISFEVPAQTSVRATATLSSQKGKFSFTAVATAGTLGWVTVTYHLKNGSAYTSPVVPLGILLPDAKDRQVPVSGMLDDALSITVNISTRPLNSGVDLRQRLAS